MDKIAVLIPCYNESQTIEEVVNDFKRVLPDAVIYVYDNNSTDGTDEIAKKAGAVVRYEYQQGKGNVIRRMFRDIDAECYIMTDGDDTYPAEFAQKWPKGFLRGRLIWWLETACLQLILWKIKDRFIIGVIQL